MSRIRLICEGRTEWELLNNLASEKIKSLIADIPKPASENLKDAKGRTVGLGNSALLPRLRNALDESTCKVVIVICDAESKEAKFTWQNIRGELDKRASKSIPEVLPSIGMDLWINDDKRVGVWVMPDNLSSGMIEDFFWSAIPETDREKPLAEAFVKGIENPKFKSKISKAKLYAWLAVQKDPSANPWQALNWNRIKKDQGKIPDFLTWIEQLLSDSSEQRNEAMYPNDALDEAN